MQGTCFTQQLHIDYNAINPLQTIFETVLQVIANNDIDLTAKLHEALDAHMMG